MLPFIHGPSAGASGKPVNLASVLERHEGELLHTSSEPDFRRVEIPLTVDGHVVHPLEFAGHAPRATEARQHAAVGTVEDIDPAVRAIGYVEVLLRRIVRE